MIRMIIRIRRLQTYERKKINSNTQYKKQVPESSYSIFCYFFKKNERETYSMYLVLYIGGIIRKEIP